MEAIILIGIQGAGKSTFYRERFFDTHVRISLDLLRTRDRERRLLELCLESGQPFVVDNTNPTASERARYIVPAGAARFSVTGFFFHPDPKGSFERNRQRARAVPPAGLFGTLKRLEPPRLEEGFGRLHGVRLEPDGGFVLDDYSV